MEVAVPTDAPHGRYPHDFCQRQAKTWDGCLVDERFAGGGYWKYQPRMLKECIFCGKSPTTREHMWPQWMRSLVPEDRRYTVHETSRLSIISDGNLIADVKGLLNSRRRNGGISSQWLKVVCKRCNETWMSRLQTGAQPYLTPLIEGNWQRLSKRARRALATWITMHAMVIETIDLPTMAIPQHERSNFKSSPQPLPGWQFWIGRIKDDGCSRNWFHRGIDLGTITSLSQFPDSSFARILPYCTIRPDTQFTVTRTGRLLTLSCSSQSVSVPDSLLDIFPFRKLWPACDSQLSKPPAELSWDVNLWAGVVTDQLLHSPF